MSDAASTAMSQPAQLGFTGLEGNAATLVEITPAPGHDTGDIVIVSRDRQAEAVLQLASGERLTLPLAAGDYLVMTRPATHAAERSNRGRCRRLLVDAGRPYGYGIPRALAAMPAAHPDSADAAPALTRLAYAGSVDNKARLVTEWSGLGPHCLCVRSVQWGEEWLPYAIPSAAAFCLTDGAYQIRAARLSQDGGHIGAWSDITELVVAEGRLAAAPSSGAGNVLDWIGVKRGWRPQGALELRAAERVDGKAGVTFGWNETEAIGRLRYVIAYRPEGGGEWMTAISAGPEQTLQLAPGRYRIRLCVIDDLVFLRSEFFVEGVVTVSATDSPVLTLSEAAAADASVVWAPLPSAHAHTEAGDELRDFLAMPISALPAGDGANEVDLNRLAYGGADGHGNDIAVARALSGGELPPDQMAAAGDYFLQAGRLDVARQVFQDLGRRYRGVDYAQLRCAQLAAISGRGNEARELLTLALLPAKDDPTRSQTVGSAAPKARDSGAAAQTPNTGAGPEPGMPADKAPQYAALLEELPALRFKAQQYDRLLREVPALRYKAKLYDEARGERGAGRGGGVVQQLRRWSGRLPRLRLR